MEPNNNYGRWSELIPDLLNEITKFFYCYNDYDNFRAVCKKWNTVLPRIPNYYQYPWLMLPFDDKTLHNRVAEQKIYHMLLPEMQNTKLRGSSFGWLIAVGVDGTLRMLHPFTKKHIDLPPLSTFPCVISYNANPDHADDEYTILDHPHDTPYKASSKHVQRALVQKVILSCPPDDVNQDSMAIAIYGNYDRLAFYRRSSGGDAGINNNSKWIDLPKPGRVDETAAQSNYEYHDAIFHAGKIYVIDKNCQIFGFDFPVTQQLTSNIIEVPAPHDFQREDFKYIIGCPDGGILIVVRGLEFYRIPNPDDPDDPQQDICPYYSSKFEIFKLDKGSKQWSSVSNSEENNFSNLEENNCMLCIGLNSSMWIPTDTTIPNGLQGNQLHFSDNFCEIQYTEVLGGNDIGVLNLDDGNITHLFPKLTSITSPPVWLV